MSVLSRLTPVGWATIIVPCGLLLGVVIREMRQDALKRQAQYDAEILAEVDGYDHDIRVELSEERRRELLEERESLMRSIAELESRKQRKGEGKRGVPLE